jgi:hypothetical protein
MVRRIPAGERYHGRTDWLSTYHHFSFNDYWDPANVRFGPLRVFNDDLIQPGTGFPPHPHRDMEIITYVLEGELEHQDSLGHRGRIRAGEVQVMSAGTGIVHAERNPSPDTPLRLLQIWVLPRRRGLTPRWEQQAFSETERRDVLLPVVSPAGAPPTPGPSRLRIDQDATVLVSSLGPGKALARESAPGRRQYLFAIAGSLTVNGVALEPGDQARIEGETGLTLGAGTAAEAILLDLP